MNKCIALIVGLFLSISLFAGELRISVPKGATVTADGNPIKVDPETGKANANFDDSGLDPNGSYGFVITVKLGEVEKSRAVKIKVGGIVSVDFTNEFKVANAQPGLTPRLLTKKEDDEKLKGISIPESLKSLEPLADFYSDYVAHAAPIDLKELRIEDAKTKLTCSVWSIGQSKKFDGEVVLDSTKSGNGRNVTLVVQDFFKDLKGEFLLVLKEGFWRGKSTEKTGTTSFEVNDFFPKPPVVPSYRGHDYSIYVQGFLGARPKLESDDYVCLSANSDNPVEFFLEAGTSYNFTADIKNTSKEVESLDSVRKNGFNSGARYTHDNTGHIIDHQQWTISNQMNISWSDARKTAFNKISGTKTAVPSHCYKKSEDSVQLMKSISVCTFTKGK